MSKNTSFFYEIKIVSNEEKENYLPHLVNGIKKRNIDESRVFKNVTKEYISSQYTDSKDNNNFYENFSESTSDEEYEEED